MERVLCAFAVIIVTLTISTYSEQVDYSSALLWTIRSNSSGASYWRLATLFGNPQVYIPILANNGSAENVSTVRHVYITNEEVFTTIAADYWTDYEYFCVSNEPSLYKALTIYLNDTSFSSIGQAVISEKVTGLAIDWVSKNLYWSDADPGSLQLGMVSLTNSFYRPVVTSGLISPNDIAVDSIAGYMFWCDQNLIRRSELTGKQQADLVTTLIQPVSLSLDNQQQLLYFYDSALLRYGSVQYSGNNLILSTLQFVNIAAVAYFRGYLFLAHGTQPDILTVNISQSSLEAVLTVNGYVGGFNDIEPFSAETQPLSTNPCSVNNGNCQHFCIPRQGNFYECQCSFGYLSTTSANQCENAPLTSGTYYLLLTDKKYSAIYQKSVFSDETVALVTSNDAVEPDAVTFDNNVLYWTDFAEKTINRLHLDTMNIDQLYKDPSGSGFFYGVAVNSQKQELYYTDAANGDVGVIKLADKSRMILRKDATSGPSGIALDEFSEYVYYTDPLRREIVRLRMTDATKQTIISGNTEPWGIALDLSGCKIYWTDFNSETIESSDLNGGNRQTFEDFSDIVSRPYSMAMSQSDIFLADYGKRFVAKVNLFSKAKSLVSENIFGGLVSVSYYSTFPKAVVNSSHCYPATTSSTSTIPTTITNGCQRCYNVLLPSVMAAVLLSLKQYQ